MKELPYAETYEREFKYWPWGKLATEVIDLLKSKIPKNARVLDLLCGPGYMLGKLQAVRPDLKLSGVDISDNFIAYAKKQYSKINFIKADVLQWTISEKYDLIICTGGLHHLPYEEQESFLKKVVSLLSSSGFCLFADPCIGDYKTEEERVLAAAELGYETLCAIVKNKGDKDMVLSALDVLHNDIMKEEFKTSLSNLKKLYSSLFSLVEVHRTWPKKDLGYGDYYFILKNPKS